MQRLRRLIPSVIEESKSIRGKKRDSSGGIPHNINYYLMAKYVDGFVLPVPKNNLAAYRRLARKASKIWRELGALEYRECWGDDLDVKMPTSYPKSLKIKPGETVVFAYIVYKSRAHRDQVNAKVMKDPRVAAMCDPDNTPFDFKRMLYGGFKTIVEA